MKVILLQDIKDLGVKGQIVNVSDGYGKNFLIPRKLVKPATEGALNDAKEKQKAQAEMLKRLKVGDKVRTVGGILGTIKYVSEQTVKLEVAPNTVIEFLRGAVDKVMEDTAADASKKDDKKDEKKDDTKKEKEGDEYKK
jgi:preprotein translocase YajC subunit